MSGVRYLLAAVLPFVLGVCAGWPIGLICGGYFTRAEDCAEECAPAKYELRLPLSRSSCACYSLTPPPAEVRR